MTHTTDTTGLSAELVETLRLAARGDDARFAEYVGRALRGTLSPAEIGVDPATYRYTDEYPAPCGCATRPNGDTWLCDEHVREDTLAILAATPERATRGQCPMCETGQRLTSVGRLATHGAERRACWGSGMLPAEPAERAERFVWSPMRAVGVKPWDDTRDEVPYADGLERDAGGELP